MSDKLAAPPSRQAIRASFGDGVCAWCGRGPYKCLASHVAGKHGVSKMQLRELGGVIAGASICSKSLSSQKRRQNAERLAADPDAWLSAAAIGRRMKKTYNSAAKDAMRSNLSKANAAAGTSAERRERALRAGTPEGWAKAMSAALKVRWNKDFDEGKMAARIRSKITA